MEVASRRRLLTILAGSAATGLGGCSGGIGGGSGGGGPDPSDDGGATDELDESDYPDALGRDRAEELRGAAVDRSGIYDHFRSLFSQRENVERITEATMDPLNALLESAGITDRFEDEPPAAAAAVKITPLPDPVDALVTATDLVTAIGHTSGINAVLDCGAYHQATSTCGFDAPRATADDVRDLNATLAEAAGQPSADRGSTGVVEAIDEYVANPGGETLDAVRERLHAEYDLTAPVLALRHWAQIVEGPYAEHPDSSDSVAYVRRIARANVSAIVGARAEIAEQLSELDADPQSNGDAGDGDGSDPAGDHFQLSEPEAPAEAPVDEYFSVGFTVSNPTDVTRSEIVTISTASGPKAELQGTELTLDAGEQQRIGLEIRAIETGELRYQVRADHAETRELATDIVESDGS